MFSSCYDIIMLHFFVVVDKQILDIVMFLTENYASISGISNISKILMEF